MRDIAEARRKGNIDDRQMKAEPIAQHGEGALMRMSSWAKVGSGKLATNIWNDGK